jgi:hypothetical protein
VAPAARPLEQTIADGVKAAPVTGIGLRLNGSSVGATATRLAGVRVDLNYRYRDLPVDNIFRIALTYDLQRKGPSWQIDASSVAEGGYLPVWATGPVKVTESEHFLALHRPELAKPEATVEEAEQARAQLSGKITFPLENRYLLLLARDKDEYDNMRSTKLAQVSAIAQVETSYEVTPDAIRVQGRQMVVNVSELHQDGSALETFRHELGHLALAEVTRPFTPPWVSESAAMYLAGTRPVNVWKAGTRTHKFDAIQFADLTRAASLGEHDSNQTSLEYAYAAAAAWFLVERFGVDHFWDLYRAYAAVPAGKVFDSLPDANPDAQRGPIEELAVATTTSALNQVYALNMTQLDGLVRQWMASQTR